MEEVRFTVIGQPQGKQRPRTIRLKNGKSCTYTPENTVLYENLIKSEYWRQVGNVRFDNGDFISARIVAFYGIPASASKKKQFEMMSGKIRPTKKPDTDNVLKVICDALNGIAYKDDAQIVHARVSKYYSDNPRVEIYLQKAN